MRAAMSEACWHCNYVQFEIGRIYCWRCCLPLAWADTSTKVVSALAEFERASQTGQEGS